MAKRRVDVPPAEYVSNIKAGEHGVMFYISKEVMRNIFFAYVKSGLENNWGVIYALPGADVDEIKKQMQDYGIDTPRYEADGSLFIQKGE
ncbi:MAG: MEDS domain-containing protein, partial [Nitrososphaeraceae archaeon]